MDVISCFCFLELTLAPGESVELPLVFRIDFAAPDHIRTFKVLYEFYPERSFPGAYQG